MANEIFVICNVYLQANIRKLSFKRISWIEYKSLNNSSRVLCNVNGVDRSIIFLLVSERESRY